MGQTLYNPHSTFQLLIFNGHGSHLNIDIINLCPENNIHLYCLPPHTTHIFQTLDVVIFRPVKAHFNKITHSKLATLGWPHPINCCKTNFIKIFKEPWESIIVVLVKKVFQKCGISPLNRDAIDKSRLSGERAITNSQQQPSAATSSNQQLPVPDEDETSSTYSNPLVTTGIISANLYNLFVIPEMNQSKQKPPRVVTKLHLLTSGKHIQMYNEKVSKKKRQSEEAKQKKGKMNESRQKQKKQGSTVRTRCRIKKRGGGIQTCGGKRN